MPVREIAGHGAFAPGPITEALMPNDATLVRPPPAELVQRLAERRAHPVIWTNSSSKKKSH